MPEIIDIAYWLDYTIAQTIDYYSLIFKGSTDLSALPECAASSTAACHRTEEREALITSSDAINYGRQDVTWEMAAGDIVRGAAMSRQSVTAYLDALEPYRALGAPLPQLSETDRELLADRTADRFDVAMLRQYDEYGKATTLREVGPFFLVQVAGRFGWTLAEAYRRMARLRPIGLTFNCRAEDCPEEIVYWQDLLAVTTHLDGQEPVVSGDVDAEHLRAAAADLGEPVEVVRARLGRYAGLLGFTVGEGAVVV